LQWSGGIFFWSNPSIGHPPLGWRVGTSGLVARTTGLVRRQFHQGHCLSDNVGCRLVRLVRLLWFLFPSEIIQSPEMVWVEPYCLKQIIRPFFSGGTSQVQKHIVLVGPAPSWGICVLKIQNRLSTLSLIIAAVSCSPQSSWIFKMTIFPND
jgi:hypothetical protein